MGLFNKFFGKKKEEKHSNLEPELRNELEDDTPDDSEEELCGIDRDHAHPKAIELIPEDFFWSNFDELAPFGSDEGDTALAEFRAWRKRNPNKETFECLRWTIEGVSEKSLSEYNEQLLDDSLIESQISDPNYLDRQYIFTVDISVIATGFGQLVDEGVIESQNKDLIQLAIDRQRIYATKFPGWEHRDVYLKNLAVLDRALKEA